jgi:hypothetical protein
MARKPDDWLITHVVTAEPIKPKEEEGLGFFVWVCIIIGALWIIGALFGQH